jgi:hypothetical protein
MSKIELMAGVKLSAEALLAFVAEKKPKSVLVVWADENDMCSAHYSTMPVERCAYLVAVANAALLFNISREQDE